MAIRLRVADGEYVALCAAKTQEEKGDIYLHDGWHYAISRKYWQDYEEINIEDKEYETIIQKCETKESSP